MALKEARIDLRVSDQLKAETEWAAVYEGQTLTNFVIEAIKRRIRELRDEYETTIISERDREAFLAILDNEDPSEALRTTARKYKELIESGELHVGHRGARREP